MWSKALVVKISTFYYWFFEVLEIVVPQEGSAKQFPHHYLYYYITTNTQSIETYISLANQVVSKVIFAKVFKYKKKFRVINWPILSLAVLIFFDKSTLSIPPWKTRISTSTKANAIFLDKTVKPTPTTTHSNTNHFLAEISASPLKIKTTTTHKKFLLLSEPTIQWKDSNTFLKTNIISCTCLANTKDSTAFSISLVLVSRTSIEANFCKTLSLML